MNDLHENSVRVRPAQPGDEAGIAAVHIASWQEAYRELLPQDFLERLPLSFARRVNTWKELIEAPHKNVIQVAEDDSGIVGFAHFSSGRDLGSEGTAEIVSIYLLARHKSTGVGFELLSSGFTAMKKRGFAKAFCWVLESNPSIKLYERSGAVFNGQTKEESIGGQKVRELAYHWGTLEVELAHWEPLSVNEVKNLFVQFPSPWWVAGGWAIDLFLKRQTRPHDDIDILIRREDQLEIQKFLSEWDLWVADPPGTLRPWKKGENIKKGVQDIYIAPEVQLLYKSKSIREKDEVDFNSTLVHLSFGQKAWLKANLALVYDGQHAWIPRL